MNVAQYIAQFLADKKINQVFAVSGGVAMYLNDALGFHPDLQFVAVHHEQSATMAAEGWSRVTGRMGAAHVTSGPGGTNALTGVCGAWIDSIPMMVISGQSATGRVVTETPLRQLGIQEVDIVGMVRGVTKYAVMLTEPNMVRYHLEKAYWYATHGRPGPVWLDVPIDVSNMTVDPDKLVGYEPEPPLRTRGVGYMETQVRKLLELIEAAERPVIVPGYGVRLADAVAELRQLVERLQIPVVTSWNASDMFPSDHPCNIGRCGLFGDRASNFAVANADLLLVIGTRLGITQIGYNPALFARGAKIAMVDIDENEILKPTARVDLPIVGDAKHFLTVMRELGGNQVRNPKVDGWLATCHDWQARYPVVLDEYRQLPDEVNSYHFVEALAERLPDGAVVVTDMGTSFTCTMQTFATKENQRLFTSSGLAAMGFGLPGAIGACFANGRRQTICIAGDGGLMFNLQELATVLQYKLPIALFVLANNGYLAMKITQRNHFGRLVGADPSTGVSCPDFVKVAQAFGMPAFDIRNVEELGPGLDRALATDGPVLVQVHMPEFQALVPRVQTMKTPEGKLLPTPIEDMFPFLDRDEFAQQMVVEPVR